MKDDEAKGKSAMQGNGMGPQDNSAPSGKAPTAEGARASNRARVPSTRLKDYVIK